jgi:ribosomal protein L21
MAKEIKVGDVLEGTGGMRVQVRVDAIDGNKVECTLVRSGKRKAMTLATLRKAYAHLAPALR